MPNFEAAKGGRIGQGRFAMLPNMSAQLTLEDGVEKGVHFALVTGSQEFYATVWEITDRTGNVETLRDVPHGPAKAHALDIAFVKHLNGCRHPSED